MTRSSAGAGAPPVPAPWDGSPVTDWERWHDPYDDPGSPLSQRLRTVQEQLRLALDRAAPGPVRLLSACAGQGRDVLPVLATHARGGDVIGRLIERDPRLCATARAAAPAAVEVVEGDAGTTTAFVGAVPADVLLLCGIFGNIDDDDVRRTVRAAPSLLATGGTVIWTRHTRAPDLTPRVRSWFAGVGVDEAAFVAVPDPGPGWAVGAGVLRTPAPPLVPGRRLFTFLEEP